MISFIFPCSQQTIKLSLFNVNLQFDNSSLFQEPGSFGGPFFGVFAPSFLTVGIVGKLVLVEKPENPAPKRPW